MKKSGKILILLAAVVVLFYAARKLTVHVLAQTDLNLRPFTAQIDHYVVKNGKEFIINHETMARTRAGALVHTGTISPYPDHPEVKFEGVRKIEFPDGFTAMVIDKIKAKSTGRLPEPMLAENKTALRNPPVNCTFGHEVFVSQETIGGQLADKVTSVSTTGLMRFTNWRLPAFACVDVQHLLEERKSANDVWTVTRGARLVSFEEHDPPSALFSQYGAYQEMSPSKAAHHYMTAYGLNMPVQNNEAAIDKRYADWNK